MATITEIATLRLMINEPANVEPYTDDALGAIIDASTSLNTAAASIWNTKAAQVAHLVDISEGGSSRKMGDVYEQFLKMAGTFEAKDAIVGSGRVARTREITR